MNDLKLSQLKKGTLLNHDEIIKKTFKSGKNLYITALKFGTKLAEKCFTIGGSYHRILTNVLNKDRIIETVYLVRHEKDRSLSFEELSHSCGRKGLALNFESDYQLLKSLDLGA